jgi:hypothetical protein
VEDELAIQRLKRLSEEAERREQRMLEFAAQRKLYRQANGGDPETVEMLERWVRENLGDRPLDPYEVLERWEMAQLWEDAEDPVK